MDAERQAAYSGPRRAVRLAPIGESWDSRGRSHNHHSNGTAAPSAKARPPTETFPSRTAGFS